MRYSPMHARATGAALSSWNYGIARWRRRRLRRSISKDRDASTSQDGISQRLDLPRLKEHLYQMVKMSPLQSYTVEVIPEDPTLSLIGAGAAAEHAGR